MQPAAKRQRLSFETGSDELSLWTEALDAVNTALSKAGPFEKNHPFGSPHVCENVTLPKHVFARESEVSVFFAGSSSPGSQIAVARLKAEIHSKVQVRTSQLAIHLYSLGTTPHSNMSLPVSLPPPLTKRLESWTPHTLSHWLSSVSNQWSLATQAPQPLPMPLLLSSQPPQIVPVSITGPGGDVQTAYTLQLPAASTASLPGQLPPALSQEPLNTSADMGALPMPK